MCDQTNSSSLQEKLYGKPFAGLFGYTHFAGGFAGGQAEYVRCPFGDTNLLLIPDSVPDEKALFLSDIIPTSYHAVKCAEVEKGKSVAIWGLGPIGLYAAKWCKLAGARRVICIDRVPERLEMASKKLGCEVINFDVQTDVVKAIYEYVLPNLSASDAISVISFYSFISLSALVWPTFAHNIGLSLKESTAPSMRLHSVIQRAYSTPFKERLGWRQTPQRLSTKPFSPFESLERSHW